MERWSSSWWGSGGREGEGQSGNFSCFMAPAGPWEMAFGVCRTGFFLERSAIKKKKGHVQKPGVCVSKTPVFAQPARRLLGAFF